MLQPLWRCSAQLLWPSAAESQLLCTVVRRQRCCSYIKQASSSTPVARSARRTQNLAGGYWLAMRGKLGAWGRLYCLLPYLSHSRLDRDLSGQTILILCHRPCHCTRQYMTAHLWRWHACSLTPAMLPRCVVCASYSSASTHTNLKVLKHTGSVQRQVGPRMPF